MPEHSERPTQVPRAILEWIDNLCEDILLRQKILIVKIHLISILWALTLCFKVPFGQSLMGPRSNWAKVSWDQSPIWPSLIKTKPHCAIVQKYHRAKFQWGQIVAMVGKREVGWRGLNWNLTFVFILLRSWISAGAAGGPLFRVCKSFGESPKFVFTPNLILCVT